VTKVNRPLRRLIRSRRVRQSALATGVAQDTAASYIAGPDLDAASTVVERLRRQGLDVSLAYLPETDEETESIAELHRALEWFGDGDRGIEFSVKPSSLGLREDPAAATEALRELATAAHDRGAFLTLEMQGAEAYDATLAMWRDVREDVPTLGITLPAEIRRSEREALTLAREGARIRICVGSYPVPRDQLHRREQDKLLAFVRCLRIVMENGGYAMVASHDATIIAITQELAGRSNVPANGFEFQMLQGVRPLEQRRLVDVGYRCRTYLPYGPAWFEYLTTRIAARPRTAFNYLRALADKR